MSAFKPEKEKKRIEMFVALAVEHGIGYERARFLAACSHTQQGRNEENRDAYIPYDDAVLIREAFRLGIGLKDTADMMGMTNEQVASFGLNFPMKSSFDNKSRGGCTYNLLHPKDHE